MKFLNNFNNQCDTVLIEYYENDQYVMVLFDNTIKAKYFFQSNNPIEETKDVVKKFLYSKNIKRFKIKQNYYEGSTHEYMAYLAQLLNEHISVVGGRISLNEINEYRRILEWEEVDCLYKGKAYRVLYDNKKISFNLEDNLYWSKNIRSLEYYINKDKMKEISSYVFLESYVEGIDVNKLINIFQEKGFNVNENFMKENEILIYNMKNIEIIDHSF